MILAGVLATGAGFDQLRQPDRAPGDELVFKPGELETIAAWLSTLAEQPDDSDMLDPKPVI